MCICVYMRVCIYICVCIYPTPPSAQDAPQSQLIKQCSTGLNPEFSFSFTKPNERLQSDLLFILGGERIIGCY